MSHPDHAAGPEGYPPHSLRLCAFLVTPRDAANLDFLRATLEAQGFPTPTDEIILRVCLQAVALTHAESLALNAISGGN